MQTEVSPEAHDFWDELWKLTTTAEDIFELIPAEDVRSLKKNRPENVVTLFTQAVAQLCQIVHTPVPMYFGQALNCVRILTRILPFLVEQSDDAFAERLCWSVEDYDTKDDTADSEEDRPQPLARLVVHAAMHLLFLPGFTVDATAFEDDDDDDELEEEEEEAEHEADGKKIGDDEKKQEVSVSVEKLPQAALWAAGIGGFDPRPPPAVAFDRNRIEVMRLLLSSICEPLFQSADSYDPWKSRWLETATEKDAPNSRLLFCSLCNIIFSYDPTGFGVPYGGALASEAPTTLVNVSTQLLVALLDFGGGITASARNQHLAKPPPSKTTTTEDDEPAAAVETKKPTRHRMNVFRRYLADFDGGDVFEFAFEGFARLLNNVHEALNTTLPGSLAQIECSQELLVLLWKFLEENDKFMPYVLRHCDVTRLVVPICFLMYQSRRDPAKVGLVHICTFLLLKLSGERPFCVALNKPFGLRLPVDLPLFEGSHADLVMIALHKMVVNGGDKLAPLYNCFLTIMCNLSPYAKSLSLVTAVKLVNLFELFTSPRFLYQNATNHVYVTLLLEIFNNVIQYQYGGNPHVVYAVVRRKQVFESLNNLTLPTAVADAKGLGGGGGSSSSNGATDQPAVPTSSTSAVTVATETRTETPSHDNDTDDPEDEIPGTPTRKEDRTHSQVEKEERKHQSKLPATGPRFVPTQEWLDRVKAELPLNTIMRLLQHLGPQIEELVSQSEFALDEPAVLDFIKNTTMVGLLPVPHAIVIRKYQPNAFTSLWFTAFMWGVIFLQNQLLPLFDGTTIQLFTVSVVN